MQSTRYPIASLPLPPLSKFLTTALTGDPTHPSVAEFQSRTLNAQPSLQRRARLLAPSAHFSYTTPLPLPFPYRIPKTDVSGDPETSARAIEGWLKTFEPLVERPLAPSRSDALLRSKSIVRKFSSDHNEYVRERHLLSLSFSCLNDCLPALDVGDALDVLGTASLTASGDSIKVLENSPSDEAARQELIDVLSGHSALMSQFPGSEGYNPTAPTYAPWSLRYSGHQFGTWAGQLGDGRAISILETPHPLDPELTYEIQLKGAGRTPFSRNADGLAAMRSSIREFLGAEGKYDVATIVSPRWPGVLMRMMCHISIERVWNTHRTAAIVARVSPTFLRIGSFESLNPPESSIIYLFSANAQQRQEQDWEALRILGEWVARHVLKIEDPPDAPWGLKLVMEVARRNAIMVAGWQAYGFMHGVINTDNVSIAGLTLDYGPYAFMDVYDYGQICNHIDDEGRYAFKFQPTVMIWAVRALLRSLGPLIGAEEQYGHAVKPNWAVNADVEQMSVWREGGQKHGDAIDKELMRVFEDHYWGLMRKRLGLKKEKPQDKSLIQGLLNILQGHDVDFHRTFRHLSYFRPTTLSPQALREAVNTASIGTTSDFITRLNESAVPSRQSAARRDWESWLAEYAARIEEEKSLWNESSLDWLEIREESMKGVNPRFVLRQRVLDEVITICENEPLGRGRSVLNKVLEMCTHPYRSWGGEGRSWEELTVEEREERRFCGLGDKAMFGF